MTYEPFNWAFTRAGLNTNNIKRYLATIGKNFCIICETLNRFWKDKFEFKGEFAGVGASTSV
jgi:hypothetical protein